MKPPHVPISSATRDASIPQTEFPDVRGPVIYNPAAFGLPTGLTFGTVGRNTLNYPGRLNFDAGLSKRFAINERMGFDFKWELFNVFNHTQFDEINNQSEVRTASPWTRLIRARTSTARTSCT